MPDKKGDSKTEKPISTKVVPCYVKGETVQMGRSADINLGTPIPLGLNQTVFSEKYSSCISVFNHDTRDNKEFNLETNSRRRIVHLEAISPNKIAVCDGKQLFIFDIKLNAIIQTFSLFDLKDPFFNWCKADRLSFSPNKEKIVYSSSSCPKSSHVYLLNLKNKNSTPLELGIGNCPTFFSNNQYAILKFSSDKGWAILFFDENNNLFFEFIAKSYRPSNFAVSPDGKYLALTGYKTNPPSPAIQVYEIVQQNESYSCKLILEKTNISLDPNISLGQIPRTAQIQCTARGEFIFSGKDGVFAFSSSHSWLTITESQQVSRPMIRGEVVEFLSSFYDWAVYNVDEPKLIFIAYHDLRELNEMLKDYLVGMPFELRAIITEYTAYSPRMFRSKVLAENIQHRCDLLLNTPEAKDSPESQKISQELTVLQSLQANSRTHPNGETALAETQKHLKDSKEFKDILTSPAMKNIFSLFAVEEEIHTKAKPKITTPSQAPKKQSGCVIN